MVTVIISLGLIVLIAEAKSSKNLNRPNIVFIMVRTRQNILRAYTRLTCYICSLPLARHRPMTWAPAMLVCTQILLLLAGGCSLLTLIAWLPRAYALPTRTRDTPCVLHHDAR